MKYKVKMLKTENATDDHSRKAEWFKKGQEYSIGENLFESFKDMGVIELVDEEPKIENKMEPSPIPTSIPTPTPMPQGKKGKKGKR